jgi:hypothetical protein
LTTKRGRKIAIEILRDLFALAVLLAIFVGVLIYLGRALGRGVFWICLFAIGLHFQFCDAYQCSRPTFYYAPV